MKRIWVNPKQLSLRHIIPRPTTEKSQCCLIAICSWGTRSSPCVEERKARYPCAPKAKRQSYCKFAGAAPKQNLVTQFAVGYGVNAGHPHNRWHNQTLGSMRCVAMFRTHSKHPSHQVRRPALSAAVVTASGSWPGLLMISAGMLGDHQHNTGLGQIFLQNRSIGLNAAPDMISHLSSVKLNI